MWIQRIIVIVLITTSGCSFAFTKKPSRSQTGEVSCNSSWTWPVVDTVVAGISVGQAIAAGSKSTNPGTEADDAKSDIVLGGVVVGAAAAAGAAYGYYRVSHCKAAKKDEHIAIQPLPKPTPDNPATARARPPVEAPIAKPAPVVADAEITARAHTKRGDELFDAGNFTKAIVEYQAAFALVPSPKLLYNIASAYDELHDFGRAREYFQRYVDADPSGTAVDAARRRITEINARQTN
ncbi:MAG: hypothetical protein H0V17_23240 [Deltaproteobacteria bacterium]|nr:hypothetical protein [Deltaproteobacteria bacterium]